MRNLAAILFIGASLTGLSAARSDPLADWAKVHEVLAHPRCANCHTPDDRPRWSDEATGVQFDHAMNVQRGRDGSGFGNPGLRCTTCHGEANGERRRVQERTRRDHPGGGHVLCRPQLTGALANEGDDNTVLGRGAHAACDTGYVLARLKFISRCCSM